MFDEQKGLHGQSKSIKEILARGRIRVMQGPCGQNKECGNHSVWGDGIEDFVSGKACGLLWNSSFSLWLLCSRVRIEAGSSWKATVWTQVRNGKALDQGSSHKIGEKWLDCRYILSLD